MAWEAEKYIVLNLQKREIKFTRKLEIELLTAIHFLPLALWVHLPALSYGWVFSLQARL